MEAKDYAAGTFHGFTDGDKQDKYKLDIFLTDLPDSASNVEIKIAEVDSWEKNGTPFNESDDIESNENDDGESENDTEEDDDTVKDNENDDWVVTITGTVENGKFCYTGFSTDEAEDGDRYLYVSLKSKIDYEKSSNMPKKITAVLPKEMYGKGGEEAEEDDEFGDNLEFAVKIYEEGDFKFRSNSPSFVKLQKDKSSNKGEKYFPAQHITIDEAYEWFDLHDFTYTKKRLARNDKWDTGKLENKIAKAKKDKDKEQKKMDSIDPYPIQGFRYWDKSGKPWYEREYLTDEEMDAKNYKKDISPDCEKCTKENKRCEKWKKEDPECKERMIGVKQMWFYGHDHKTHLKNKKKYSEAYFEKEKIKNYIKKAEELLKERQSTKPEPPSDYANENACILDLNQEKVMEFSGVRIQTWDNSKKVGRSKMNVGWHFHFDPIFCMTFIQYCKYLHDNFGVTNVYTAGFARFPYTPKDKTHPRGRAVDIAGFKAHNKNICFHGGSNKRTDWFNEKDTIDELGLNYSQFIRRMGEVLTNFFGYVIGPCTDKFHKDHYHAQLKGFSGGKEKAFGKYQAYLRDPVYTSWWLFGLTKRPKKKKKK